jgi:S1-C subfamily serine protease
MRLANGISSLVFTHLTNYYFKFRRNTKGARSGPVKVTRGAGEPMGMGFVTEGNEHTISQINPGNAADKAGLQVGDILKKVSGISTSALPHEALLAVIGGAGTGRVLRRNFTLEYAIGLHACSRETTCVAPSAFHPGVHSLTG